MNSLTSNLKNTIIRQASKAQRTEVIKRVTDQWGTPQVGLEFFTRLHDLVETKEYASNGKLIHWVLVSENDQETLDFYSCCRTFRRDVLVLRPGQEQPTSEIAYAVSAVMTHPSYRGKGYAQRMMTLLHHALAPHMYGDSGIKIPPSVGPATLSILYSDVGNFYERCSPSSEESGWTLVESISTVWDLPKSLELLEDLPNTSLQAQMLTDDQVWALLLSDIPVLEPSPRPTPLIQFAFPSASPNIHMITRSAINPHHVKSSSTFWGAHIPSKGSFITWTFSYGPPHELQINRLKATPETLPILLRVAFCEGAKQGCVKAEVWALPEDLLGTARVLLGVNAERKSSLPAVKWYGREQIDGIEWVMNEQYSWC